MRTIRPMITFPVVELPEKGDTKAGQLIDEYQFVTPDAFDNNASCIIRTLADEALQAGFHTISYDCGNSEETTDVIQFFVPIAIPVVGDTPEERFVYAVKWFGMGIEGGDRFYRISGSEGRFIYGDRIVNYLADEFGLWLLRSGQMSHDIYSVEFGECIDE